MTNMHKKTKNAFTLVELVIVIAVIGILAAVLIPTFANVIKMAKESARNQQLKAIQKEYISACQLVPLEETIGSIIVIDDDYYIINEKFDIVKIDNIEDYNIEEKYVEVPNLSIPKNTKVLKPTEQSSYKIEFIVKDGTPVGDLYYTAGKGLDSLPNAEKLGYNFLGWTKTESEEDTDYVTSIDSKTSNNIKLYAKFSARKDNTYNVSYYFENINDNDYTLDNTLSKTYNNGVTDEVLTIQPDEKTGFDLVESNVTSKKIEADGSTKFEIYYKRKIYTINWYREDGSLVESENYKYEAMPKYPESSNPEKTQTETNEYEFMGWSLSKNETTTTNLSKVTEDRSYYPVFKESGRTFVLVIKDCNDYQLTSKKYKFGEGLKLQRHDNILGWTETKDVSDTNYISEIGSDEYGDKVLYQKEIASSVFFGSYGGEALEWEVLDIIDGNALMATKKVYYPYNLFYGSYEASVDEDDEFFKNAFSEYEKSLIQTKSFTSNGNEYTGKLLLLNDTEYNKYYLNGNHSLFNNNESISNHYVYMTKNDPTYPNNKTMKEIIYEDIPNKELYIPVLSNSSNDCYYSSTGSRELIYDQAFPTEHSADGQERLCYSGVILTMLVKINLTSTLTYHIDADSTLNIIDSDGNYNEIKGNADGTTTYTINFDITSPYIELPQLQNEGTSYISYTFDGWYMDKKLTMPLGDRSTNYVYGFFNVDVYPKWSIHISGLNQSWYLIETNTDGTSTLIGFDGVTVPYNVLYDQNYYNSDYSEIEIDGMTYNTFYNYLNNDYSGSGYKSTLINAIRSIETLGSGSLSNYSISSKLFTNNAYSTNDTRYWLASNGSTFEYINEFGYLETRESAEAEYYSIAHYMVIDLSKLK